MCMTIVCRHLTLPLACAAEHLAHLLLGGQSALGWPSGHPSACSAGRRCAQSSRCWRWPSCLGLQGCSGWSSPAVRAAFMCKRSWQGWLGLMGAWA